jgi:lipopolysaccharide export LptBFGC system permease protein LptF
MPFSLIALVVIACSFIFGPLRQQSMGFRLVIALFIGLGFYYMQDFWVMRVWFIRRRLHGLSLFRLS